jgi:CheY-like chemotaxis protein
VEDNHSVVALFRRYLTGHGYRLVPIEDAPGALQAIAKIRPEAIILDVMMRSVDGWQVLQGLKSDPSLAPIPVVVCSVLDDPELAFSIGAQAYLRKPVRPAQLLECLAGLLPRRA